MTSDRERLQFLYAPTLREGSAGKFQNPKGGLNDAGRKKFGVKAGVKNYSSASLEDKKRWVRWALRFTKTPQPLRKPNGEPTRYALMFAAWGEPVPTSAEAVRKVHAKAVARAKELKMGQYAAQGGSDSEDLELDEQAYWQGIIEDLDGLDALPIADGGERDDEPEPEQQPETDTLITLVEDRALRTRVDSAQIVRAFLTEANGRTILTAPASAFDSGWEKASDANKHYLWLQGRFVGAEKPNANNAFWTTADLELGHPSVANGPLNWLHEGRHIIGTIADARLVKPESQAVLTQAQQEMAASLTRSITEQARSFTAEQRRKLASEGKAMPDGSFPIVTVEDLRNAIRLAHTPAQRRHVIKRARALGAMNLIPDTWTEKSATEHLLAVETSDVAEPHIVALSAVWRWIYPDEAYVIEQASSLGKLFYSMECISERVACVGEGGCGRETGYMEYIQGAGCEHVQARASTRRFVEPTFLGGAAIVPPVTPGWAHASATVMKQAAAAAEKAYVQAGSPDVSASDWERLMAQVLLFAGVRP